MIANVFRALFVFGFILTAALAPIMAEMTETLKTEDAEVVPGGVQPSSPGTSVKGNSSIEQGGSPTAQLFDSAELASLESRAEEPGEEVAGGALTNQQLTYIVIALAAAVIVLVLT
jgi:hypothetical protein